MENKKGMSAVIVTLLLVVLSIVLIAVVWTTVNNLVNDKIKNTSACFGNFDKITLNQMYTCYNSTGKTVQISIKRGDLSLDAVVVSISGSGGSETFEISNESGTVQNLKSYSGSSSVVLPDKNSGSTYVFNWTDSYDPVSVSILPVIGGTKCSPSDTISQISDCSLLA